MKKLLPIFIIISLILSIVAYRLFSKNQLTSTVYTPNDSILPYNDLKIIDIGEVESIIEYGEHSVIGIHFPIFGIDNIDSITRSWIQGYIDEFKILVKDYSTENESYKSELSIDYETYILSDNTIIVKFTILESMPYYAHPNMTIISKAYDLINEMPVVVVSSQVNEEVPQDISLNTSNVEIVSSPRDIDLNKPMVALTFDDGPNKNTTTPILDTLAEYNGVATFFVLGNRVSNNGILLNRMISEGSEIGNHSYNHKQLTTVSSSEVKSQINKTQDAVMKVVGTKPVVMRPTYGSYDNILKSQIKMPMILWSIDTLDWKSKDPKAIATHVLDNIEDGDIVLMHDIYSSTADAVKIIVPELISRGYQLVTVSELYELRGEALEVGNIYNHLYK